MAPERSEITPADDPYEFDWPDDSKEERAAEREAAAAKADVQPAPLWLSEVVLGLSVVLAFIFPVTVVAGNAVPPFVQVVLWVVVGGIVVGWVPAVLLKFASRSWRRGLAELAAIVLGFIVGLGWTWLLITLQGAAPPVRVRAAVFMGTSVAAGYYVAAVWAPKLRTYPRFIYITCAVLAGLTILSLIAPFVLG